MPAIRHSIEWLLIFAVIALTPFAARCQTAVEHKTSARSRLVVYGKSYPASGAPIERVMRVYMPSETPPGGSSAVVLLQGNPADKPYPGGRQDGYEDWAEFLTTRGYVLAVAVWDLHQGHDDCLVQVKAAIRHLRADAAEYGINPERIASFGSSYSGSWAIALAVTDDTFGVPNDREKADPLNHWGVSARVKAAIAAPGGVFFPDACDKDDAPILYLRGRNDGNFNQVDRHLHDLTAGDVPFAWFPVDDAGHTFEIPTKVAFGLTFGEIVVEFLKLSLGNTEGSRLAMLHVCVDGKGTVEVSPIHRLYSKGTEVTLRAFPSEGQRFTGWIGDLTGNTDTAALKIDHNTRVTAVFSPKEAAAP